MHSVYDWIGLYNICYIGHHALSAALTVIIMWHYLVFTIFPEVFKKIDVALIVYFQNYQFHWIEMQFVQLGNFTKHTNLPKMEQINLDGW